MVTTKNNFNVNVEDTSINGETRNMKTTGDRGERLLQFAISNNLTISDTSVILQWKILSRSLRRNGKYICWTYPC